MDFLEIKEKLNKASIRKQSSEELLASRQKRKEEIKNEIETILKSQALLQEVAKEVQSQLSLKIDSVVNLGLATCFGNEYTFKLEYVSSRGKTEVEFNLYKDNKLIDPMMQNGGGLVDILCFCLRVAVYSISKVDNIIVFDEAMKYVSKGYRSKAAELIHTLSEKLDLQFISVTHIEEMVDDSDKQIVVGKREGVSYVL
jgi:hypothetical protein